MHGTQPPPQRQQQHCQPAATLPSAAGHWCSLWDPTPIALVRSGGALLLAYTLGYVAPLLAAALFSGALTRLLAARKWSAWVTPVSGVLLVAGGTYALLSRLVPA